MRFDHPATRDHVETRLVAEIIEQIAQIALELAPPGMDDRQGDAGALLGPLPRGSRIALIGTDELRPEIARFKGRPRPVSPRSDRGGLRDARRL